ncbi:SDR family NAD(P)-dependent oxidoreductase [Burkholderia cenocepacia]|nr:SDR family NAD(P)-dependent oxidoreductase [Burkholderia cenocepacia]RQZ83547.1 SDR family NAD(P)-dependent oxidoreductase [Burkholderia cenocepacia]RRA04053.1 SDR family NAD(P)-dependent oxidoreductase [Burkholderia cenocepacia]
MTVSHDKFGVHDFSGRVACVIGGTRGIGWAVCERLARHGASVVTCGSTADSVRSCEERAKQDGLSIAAYMLDGASEEGIDSLISTVLGRYGRLDTLVPAVGRPHKGNAARTSAQEWDDCMSVNLRAPFLAARRALPHLVETGGSIVFISSIWAITATYDRVAYTVAKSGVSALTRALAVDHAKDGVRVNAVAPGYVDTPLLRKSLLDANPGGQLDDLLAEAKRRHPMLKIATPDDVACAVEYLAGPGSSLITGQTLVVDGGATTRFGLADMWGR